MAIVTYRGIELDVVQTNEFGRKEVMSSDGTTYLYTEWTIDVNCVLNPQATSYIAGAVGVSPTQQDGKNSTDTDKAIREWLLQPRGTLSVSVDGLLLTSPLSGYVVDAANGPIPEICTITSVIGIKTLIVHFRIKTCVNEIGGDSPSNRYILLSHRWKWSASIDKDHLTTRTTEGEAIFRADVLADSGTTPDQYRAFLFPPVPSNFRRTSVEVLEPADGNKVLYRVVDTEHFFNVGTNSPSTRIECYQTVNYQKAGLGQAAASGLGSSVAAGAASGAVVGGGLALSTGGALTPAILVGAGIGGVGGAAKHLLTGAASALTPSINNHIFVRVWGNRSSNRRALEDLAFAIALARVGVPGEGVNTEMILTHDVAGKFVELMLSLRFGAESLSLFQNQVTAVRSKFPAIDDTPGLLFQAQSNNPGLPNSSGTRGTWRGQLVTQALSNPAAMPPIVPRVGDTLTTDVAPQ